MILGHNNHKLLSTYGDNILSPNRNTLMVEIMNGYNIDTNGMIAWEILDWAINSQTSISFPILVTQICFEDGCPIPPNAD